MSTSQTKEDTPMTEVANAMDGNEQTDASKAVVTLIMRTKLGESKQKFLLADLIKIDYFKNNLSGRWKYDEPEHISSNEMNFATPELESLIFYMKNGIINRKFALQRLPYFCHAFDYLTAGGKLTVKEFALFFTKCVPAVTHEQLVSLKSLCTTNECSVLLQAIKAQIKRFDESHEHFHAKMLRKWETAPIKLLASVDAVAAEVFMDQFQVDRPPEPVRNDPWDRGDDYDDYDDYMNQYGYDEYGQSDDDHDLPQFSGQIKYTTSRDDLHELWAGIAQRKLCLQYPEILDRISSLKYYGGREASIVESEVSATDINVHMAQTLVKIAVDTTELILTENVGKPKVLKNKLNNFKFKAMINNFYELINESSSARSYVLTLMKSVCATLFALEKAGYDTVDVMKAVFSYSRDNNWFWVAAQKEEKWITVEVPNHYSVEVVDHVCEFILDYILSSEYKSNPCSRAYIRFIKKHKNIELPV